MSEVAGRLATQAGAFMLGRPAGGRGVLLGGVPGVAAGKVVVIGGGIVGLNAARIAVGMQANVYVLDRSIDRMRELDAIFAGTRQTASTRPALAIEERLAERRPRDRRRPGRRERGRRSCLPRAARR